MAPSEAEDINCNENEARVGRVLEQLSVKDLGRLLSDGLCGRRRLAPHELDLALAAAAIRGRAQHVALLVAAGADPALLHERHHNGGATALHLLVFGADDATSPDELRRCMLDLLSCGGGEVLLETLEDKHVATALTWAGMFQKAASARILLELGANINAADKYGNRFLDYAARQDPRTGTCPAREAFDEWEREGRPVLQWDRPEKLAGALDFVRRRPDIAGLLESEARIDGAQAALACAQIWSKFDSMNGRCLPAPALDLIAHALMPSKMNLTASARGRHAWSPVSHPRIPLSLVQRACVHA